MGNDAAVIRVVNEFFASRIAPPGQHPHTTNNNTSGGGRSSNDQCQPQNGSNNSSNINGSTSTGSAMKLGQNAYSAAVGGANSNSNGVGGKTAVPADGWRALSRNDDAEQDYKSSGSSKGKGSRAAGSAKPEALVEQVGFECACVCACLCACLCAHASCKPLGGENLHVRRRVSARVANSLGSK